MPRIAILSASVRQGRRSQRVALFLQRSLSSVGDIDLVDLAAYAFPVFDERLKYQKDPLPAAKEFADRIASADGVIIVTPEYNGVFPASLKNVIDLLVDEWKRKPVALCAVSDGPFGGSQVLTSLLFSLWKIRAWVMSTPMRIPNVDKAFNADGEPTEPDVWPKRLKPFVDDLLWAVEARRRMA